MSNEVNAIIDNIAEKLGTTAALLVPEFAKYKMAEHLVFLICGIIFAILTIIFIYYSTKIEDGYVSEFLCVTSVISGLVATIGIVIGMFFIPWLLSPMGATCSYILERIR